jgi:hypothetical protein
MGEPYADAYLRTLANVGCPRESTLLHFSTSANLSEQATGSSTSRHPSVSQRHATSSLHAACLLTAAMGSGRASRSAIAGAKKCTDIQSGAEEGLTSRQQGCQSISLTTTRRWYTGVRHGAAETLLGPRPPWTGPFCSASESISAQVLVVSRDCGHQWHSVAERTKSGRPCNTTRRAA